MSGLDPSSLWCTVVQACSSASAAVMRDCGERRAGKVLVSAGQRGPGRRAAGGSAAIKNERGMNAHEMQGGARFVVAVEASLHQLPGAGADARPALLAFVEPALHDVLREPPQQARALSVRRRDRPPFLAHAQVSIPAAATGVILSALSVLQTVVVRIGRYSDIAHI